MIVPVAAEGLTFAEFGRLFDHEGPFELIDGQRIVKMPSFAIHGWVIRVIMRLLDQFVQNHQLGEVFSEMTFAQTADGNWVKGSRIPDVMFFAADRWNAYLNANPDWLNKPILLIPDLVVEVLSENDLFSDVFAKVERDLQNGVQAVWLVDPKLRAVTVYSAGGQYTYYDINAVLSGGALLPGLQISVKDLFSAL
jgi:Uma2 family endonuclease